MIHTSVSETYANHQQHYQGSIVPDVISLVHYIGILQSLSNSTTQNKTAYFFLKTTML